jgi:hypothetical protein
MPNDPKWRTIAKVSGQPIALVQAVYLQLLVSASQNQVTDETGVTLHVVTVTNEDIASSLDVTERNVISVTDAMQGRVLSGNAISGWHKRQANYSGARNDGKPAKTVAQRVREHRERKKQKELEERNVTASNVTETLGNDVTPQIRKEEIREEVKDKTPHIERADTNALPADELPPPESVEDFWSDDPAVKLPMTTSWKPSPDFRQRAAIWNVILPATGWEPHELAAFRDYWKAEGKALHQVQWEQKFARHLASQSAGLPQAGKSGRQRRGGVVPSGNYDEKPAGFS